MATNTNRRRMMLLAAPLAVVAAIAVVAATGDESGSDISYRMAKITRGPLTSAISATGTLEAVTTVVVGSQVSGQLSEIAADFNSDVTEGQVIARIDPADFEADVRQKRAELAVARAAVTQQEAAVVRAEADLSNAIAAEAAARADIGRMEAMLEDARKDLARKEQLAKTRSIPLSQRDRAVYVRDAAKADLAAVKARARAQVSNVESRRAQIDMAKAEVTQSRAQVARAEAALSRAEVALEHTYIRAPVNGVVILRNVDVGETVAASTQSPDLFTIARDLREMQVKTSVDEADIGQVRIGLDTVFTVDSFPGREFRGTVRQVRKSPKVEQSVVSYDVMISAENADLRLLPGMTANVRIIVQAYDDALKAPNAALRFRPLAGDPAAALTPAGGPAPGQAAAAPSNTGGPPQRGPRRRANPDATIARMTEALGLSEAQQAQIREIITAAGPGLRRMRQSGASPQEIREFLQATRLENRGRIAEVLTEAQRAKFNAQIERRATQPRTRAVLWLLDAAGAVRPVSVLAGASDGSATLIIAGAGEVADGQSVITGYDRAPPAPSDGSASFRRRLGF